MPAPNHHHDACVEAWLTRCDFGSSPERLIPYLERAVTTIWQHCRSRLGEITVMAITDRVLHETRERHPCFGSISFDDDGIAFDGLRDAVRKSSIADVQGAARFLVCEYLRIVGRLTAEVLTPALHAELAKLRADGGPP